MVQAPGKILWVGTVKISEKGVVVKVKQARSVIRQGVLDAWRVVFEGDVAVETLMEGLLSKNGSSGGGAGDRTFAIPI